MHARPQTLESARGSGLLFDRECDEREVALNPGELLLCLRIIAQGGGHGGHLFRRKGLHRVEREVLGRNWA